MNSKRIIAKNMLSLYLKSLLVLSFSLFSSRWVLGSLGVVDFGLFSVVGSVIVFITFLNGVMSVSASRNIAYAIGTGSSEEVRAWFNTSLSLHLIIPFFLIIVGFFVGEYCVRNVLTIPPDRLESCITVFRMSLIAAFFNMSCVPFQAMFTAKQHFSILAILGALNSVLSFGFAFVLTRASGDLLIFYGSYMMGINICIPLATAFIAYGRYQECRINFGYWFYWQRVKKIIYFAFWELFGNLGYVLRNQGTAILVNKYFGPTTGASYGIANQVSSQSTSLSSSLASAFAPAITTSEGSGNSKRVLSLSMASCKYGAFLVLLFAIPLMVEINYILTLWLETYPAYTAELTQLVLLSLIADKVSGGYTSTLIAHGKIALYQSILGTLMILTVPIIWFLFSKGYSPVVLGYVFIGIRLLCSFGRVYFVKKLLNYPVFKWLKEVFLPIVLILSTSSLLAICIQALYLPSFLRLSIICFATFSASCVLGVFFVMQADERILAHNKIVQIWYKFTN